MDLTLYQQVILFTHLTSNLNLILLHKIESFEDLQLKLTVLQNSASCHQLISQFDSRNVFEHSRIFTFDCFVDYFKD